jgi:hypothetical protein
MLDGRWEVFVSSRSLIDVCHSSKLVTGGASKVLNVPQVVHMQPKPMPSPIFTGRNKIMETLDTFFSDRPHGSSPRREYLLYGLGGAGKTQILLQFVQQYQDR